MGIIGGPAAASALLAAMVLAGGWAQPVLGVGPRGTADDIIVVNGRTEVARNESAGNIFVLNGGVLIDGRVEGSVAVVNGGADVVLGEVAGSVVSANGSVRVSGTVLGDVVVFRGKAVLEDGARVAGDVRSSWEPMISEGAVLEGRARSLYGVGDVVPGSLPLAAARAGLWLAVSVSTLVLGLLLLGIAPGPAAAVVEGISFSSAIGLGLLAFLGMPLLALIAFATVVGIPLGAGLLLALAPLYMFGYVVSAWSLGRAVVRPPKSRWAAFLTGWAILRVLALLPVAGAVAWLIAVILGLGTLLTSARRDRAPTLEPAARAS